jgi:hypothetical protein
MRRFLAMIALLAAVSGCGGDDDDDVAEVKKPLPLDQVPPAIMKAAKEAAPNLTFFAAYEGTYQGKPSIEVKGRTKSGQIKELEISPDGKILGTE